MKLSVFYQKTYLELGKKWLANLILRNEIRLAPHATIREDTELKEKMKSFKFR